MTNPRRFDSIYTHGFVRVAVGAPRVEVAAPKANARRTLDLMEQASAHHARIALFPELGISAYSNEDLVQQDALLDAVEAAVHEMLEASRRLPLLVVVGAPVRLEQRLFNCALVLCRGELLGVVPKTYLPNYREFYEKRQFASAVQAVGDTAQVAGCRAPFGNDLLFEARNVPDLAMHVEVCEDVRVPIPAP
jgi:NAD+ synthase (glutamine-hydrolysing)